MLPRVTTRGAWGGGHMPKIVHFEIPADDPERAIAFYQDVLGWTVSRYGEEPYWLVRAGEDEEPGANGALVSRQDLRQAPVLIAGVGDVDDVLARAQKSGGEVVQGKLAVPGMGWSAYIRDPEGNTVGFFQQDTNAAAAP